MDADGNFILAWASDGQDDPAGFYVPGIFAQRYAGADGGNTILWRRSGFKRLEARSIGGVPLVWQVQ